MFGIGLGDVVAASLAAAGACLICSIPRDFVGHLLRNFPGWVMRTYGRRALVIPVLVMLVIGRLVELGVNGQMNSPAGQAMVIAAAFLALVIASALLRFYFSDYRKSR
ncbi:hypothetical protein EM868_06105 [Cupriavidus gilardii]|uniref:hypothetical protein n=1 Tax=Cupriavidus gilardii TaxID=82541 RepID=UPI001571AF87|nr:hypothetical protein [Cupriavidus gilardii]MBO4119695.1 hypothetical protein [Cupriavidus gilardii]MCG5260231.1 hypothetical protein [Cupriavidus gilardii]MDF9429368.1 hypothetical protein [Cupriavidus gilardii]NSX05981.1 hypothetical protein [Cupriavidus gilardii]